MSEYRNRAHRTAETIEAALADDRIIEFLTDDERDWCLLLSERFYAIYNRRAERLDTAR